MMGMTAGTIWTGRVMSLISPMFPPQVDAQTAPAPPKAHAIQVAPRVTAKSVYTMSAKPVWDVGGLKDSPEDEFQSHDEAVQGVMLANGGLAVIDVSKVRIFDATTKQHAVVGRFWHGPNEFAQLYFICKTRGDTLVVWDQHQRNSVIAPKGTIVRQWKSATTGAIRSVCFDDGTIILERSGRSADGSPARLLSRSDLLGRMVRDLGAYPATQVLTTRPAAVVLRRLKNTFFIANAKTLNIQRYALDGQLLSVLRLNEKRKP